MPALHAGFPVDYPWPDEPRPVDEIIRRAREQASGEAGAKLLYAMADYEAGLITLDELRASIAEAPRDRP